MEKQINKTNEDSSKIVNRAEGNMIFNSHSEDTEYIKITKNTKGYNWDIKLIAKPNVDLIKEIEIVNQQMVKRFGNPATGLAKYEKEGPITK